MTTMTVSALLARYNELADKPLAKWSASKAKLQERIDELEAARAAASKRDPNTFTPADVARELGVNAKVLRAKVRRLTAAGTFPVKPVTGTRYHRDDLPAFREAIRPTK